MRSRSMNTVAHLQRRRVRAEPADRCFPHHARIRVEDDIERRHRTSARPTARAPHRAARGPSRHTRRARAHAARDASRARAAAGAARSTDTTLDDHAVILFDRFVGREDPAAIRLDRPARAEDEIVAELDRRSEAHHRALAAASVGRFSTRPNAPSGRKSQSRITVLREIRILQLRHREQQRRLEIVRHESILPRRTLPPPPSSNQPRTASSLPVSSRRLAPGGSMTDAPSR